MQKLYSATSPNFPDRGDVLVKIDQCMEEDRCTRCVGLRVMVAQWLVCQTDLHLSEFVICMKFLINGMDYTHPSTSFGIDYDEELRSVLKKLVPEAGIAYNKLSCTGYVGDTQYVHGDSIDVVDNRFPGYPDVIRTTWVDVKIRFVTEDLDKARLVFRSNQKLEVSRKL